MHKSTNETGASKPSNSTQFKPGQSGNPKGRPRKKIYDPPEMTGLDIMDQPFAKMIEEEGLRPVEVSDGKGKTEEIPAFQAVMRSLVHQAAKGSRLAATQFADLFSSVQRARREEKQSSLASVLDLKLLLAKQPDGPEAQLIADHGPNFERVRVNPNGLLDFDVGPDDLTARQIAELEHLRESIADALSDARERLADASNALVREIHASHVERLDDQFRRVNAGLPEDRQLSLLDFGEHEGDKERA